MMGCRVGDVCLLDVRSPCPVVFSYILCHAMCSVCVCPFSLFGRPAGQLQRKGLCTCMQGYTSGQGRSSSWFLLPARSLCARLRHLREYHFLLLVLKVL